MRAQVQRFCNLRRKLEDAGTRELPGLGVVHSVCAARGEATLRESSSHFESSGGLGSREGDQPRPSEGEEAQTELRARGVVPELSPC